MTSRPAELIFHGAAGVVTGSCHELRYRGASILFDCGLFQGQEEERNERPFPFDPETIDAVVLSHAHIDHSGRIPQLVKEGFEGPIYAHPATTDLCRVMLRDSAFIQEQDAAFANRRRRSSAEAMVEPLYTQADAHAAMRQFQEVEYDTPRDVAPGVRLRFRDAGHILGSSTVELALDDDDGSPLRRIVFSGDLGHRDKPVLRDPVHVREADLVLLESTYGDRDHRSWDATWEELGEIFAAARHDHGNVLIPVFAVGRTQQLLYAFQEHFDEWGLAPWTVYLDSPLAIEATRIYERHEDVYDEAARRARARHGSPFELPNLEYCVYPQDSMKLNETRSGAIILAGSGMCTGGRIRHHIKYHGGNPGCHLVIVGFQAQGTLGRALVDGARSVRIHGQEVRIAAHVHTVGGLSAHADATGLADWYGHFEGRPRVALVHGEPEASAALASRLRSEYAPREVLVPRVGDRVEL